MAAALQGLKAYQAAERPARAPFAAIVARIGRACLRDYGGEGRPVVFVPSLINPPNVLDLAENNSLLRWLATQGIRPLLVDWGTPRRDERTLSIAGHVERLLLPLIDSLGERVTLAGYCLGGTMAIAAAARRPVAGLALIATPWRFSGFPDKARGDLANLWTRTEYAAEALGMLPMEVLQASFWRLDPARTVRKFEDYAAMIPDSPEARGFVALEDWANDGPPLTRAAALELLRDFFWEDRPGEGRWHVDGAPVDPARLACPVFDIVSTTDRIVPAASAIGVGKTLMLAQGHVGMIVGRSARKALWEPLAAWLSQSHNC